MSKKSSGVHEEINEDQKSADLADGTPRALVNRNGSNEWVPTGELAGETKSLEDRPPAPEPETEEPKPMQCGLIDSVEFCRMIKAPRSSVPAVERVWTLSEAFTFDRIVRVMGVRLDTRPYLVVKEAYDFWKEFSGQPVKEDKKQETET